MGAWIEINAVTAPFEAPIVAPHMGAWIEIVKGQGDKLSGLVAPHMGAWIEIWNFRRNDGRILSHPTWVRGLKFVVVSILFLTTIVAPHMGAWIEI